MARFAVTRERNVALLGQILDVFLVKRLAESIGVRRFAPLRMDIRMTGRAARSGNKILARDKFPVKSRRVRRRERTLFAEAKIVAFGNPVGIFLARHFAALNLIKAPESDGGKSRKRDYRKFYKANFHMERRR